MHKLMIAFHKVKKDSALDSKLIAWWTNGKYDHTELIIVENNVAMMYSAISYENIVRSKKHYINKDIYDYVNIKCSSNDLTIIKQFLNGIIGKKYDWLGILGFIIPFKDRENKWFCSEVVSNALKIIGKPYMFNREPSTISPNKLAIILGLDNPKIPLYKIKNRFTE